MMISELYTMYREVSIMEKRRQETLDGNTAAAYISYAFTEMATIFPITPSSVMAEEVDEWAALGKKNIFGNTVTVREMQSEKGASAAMHGSLQSGALTTTYTASQGLMLMLPVMFRIAGELLPGVYHVASRAVGNNGFSIFGDHQDVMAVRTTGSVMISSGSVQECMDLGAVAHLSAIKCRLPVVHFFDGFRTSHEIQKIDMLEYDEMKEIIDMDAVNAFRARAMSPDDPVLRGCTQNPDVYFQQREAVNKFYMPVADTVQHYMDEINKLTGREYKLFNYYGAEDAESIIVSMGSSCSVIRETIDFLNRQGRKYGLLQVHLYRPFAVERFLDAMPAAVKRIAVLDRTKEPGANGEPLYQDVCTAFSGSGSTPLIIGGRYGIASKDFTPANVMEVYKNLEQKDPQDHFTVGIVDNVTFTSLPPLGYDIDTKPEGLKECKFWGFGSDGTVGANKAAIKIIGNHTDMIVEGDNIPLDEPAGGSAALSAADKKIAELVVPEIADGSCLQLGIGAVPNAVGKMIAGSDLRDLGVHSELYVDSFVDMAGAGHITGLKKNIDRGRQVYTFAFGTKGLYEYLDNNPECYIAPVDYVNNIGVISQIDNFVSINGAVEVDLFGQVSSESSGTRHISGAGGQQDFVMGAFLSNGGKSFICLSSTYRDKKTGELKSRIRPTLEEGTIVTCTRSNLHWVVTEYGKFNVKGKSTWERAEGLISIAHPAVRDGLIDEAEKMHIWRHSNKR